jgi:puromycin-sensitive aminopeptidase
MNIGTTPFASVSADEARWRLPTAVRPIRYELLLAPDVTTSTFAGNVRIECSVIEPTSEIVLNAADLQVGHASVEVAGRSLEVTAVTLDDAAEQVTIGLGEPLSGGEDIRVEIDFKGILNDQLRGFYRSKFTPVGSPEGSDEIIATTHFEPTDARRAFPCFDEPDLKAVFAITVDVPAGLGVWSNWSVASEEPLAAGGRRVRFGDTMIMSTYLVAVVVGPLSQTDPVDAGGVPITVVHVPGKEHLARFALEAAHHSVRFFNEWFEIPYPAAKLDLIALPDFAMGAMENLGCVTFRESALLVDEDHASLAELQRVSQVVAHEIAHMWFGDLVTMRWWDGIWLNEAFATLMEVMCVDDFRPEWDLWTVFGTMRERAMAIDALHTTRPVEFAVGKPEEAEAMFDPLTYEKGAGVLRMLERYIGAEQFREGIRLYLKRHSYGNTDAPDLWAALEESSGEPVSLIMDTWLHQGGFPLVQVQLQPGVDLGAPSVALTQVPFMFSPEPHDASAIGHMWKVPTMLRTIGDGKTGGDSKDTSFTRALLDSGELVVELEGGGPAVVNAGGSGVYRVQYPEEHLLELASRSSDLATLERFYLLSDTWAAVLADRTPLREFLALAETLVVEPADERDPDVWGQITGALSLMYRAVPDSAIPDLRAYTRALVGPVFEQLGWEHGPSDSERVKSLRSQLLALLGTVGGDPTVQARCLQLHHDFVAGGAPLDPELAPAIVATVAACGGVDEYDACYARFKNPSTPQEEVRYLGALAGFGDPALAERTFELARTEVRTQNAYFVIAMLMANRAAGPATWGRVTAHWDELLARFPGSLMTRMLESARLLCKDRVLAGEVGAFLAAHPVPTGEKAIAQTIERLDVNSTLAARLAAQVGTELEAATDRLKALRDPK